MTPAASATTAFTEPQALEKATGLSRALAYFIDLALLYVYIAVLFMASVAVDSVLPFHERMGESYWLRHSIALFTLTVPMVLYFIVMERGRRQGTFGKAWMRLKVIRVDGAPAAGKALTIRNVVKFLPWEIAHLHIHLNPDYLTTGETSTIGWVLGVGFPFAMMVIYAGMVFFAKDGRALYERLSGTRVVNSLNATGSNHE